MATILIARTSLPGVAPKRAAQKVSTTGIPTEATKRTVTSASASLVYFRVYSGRTDDRWVVWFEAPLRTNQTSMSSLKDSGSRVADEIYVGDSQLLVTGKQDAGSRKST